MELGLHCVYTHSIDGNVFYVGAGKVKRAFDEGNRNKKWKAITKEHRTYDIEILYETKDRNEAILREREEISKRRPKANIAGSGNWKAI